MRNSKTLNHLFFSRMHYTFLNTTIMKSIIFATCLALFSNLLSAQSFFTVGANYSTLSTMYDFPFGKQKLENFKLTPSFGYGYNLNISEKWSYQPGITLGDLGGSRSTSNYYILSASLNQFIDFKPLPWMSFGVSPTVYYVGFAGVQSGSWRKYEDRINRLVLSVMPRVTCHLTERWCADLLYRIDLTSVGDPNPPVPTVNLKYKGYGLGINLKYQIK